MPRPCITLKVATSLDGKIALSNGQSEWITNEKSRAQGRKLRAQHDAIVIGANTAVLDNPQLTTRIDGEPDPIRIVFDTNLRISLRSNLVRTAEDAPVWIFCGSSESEKAGLLREQGVKLFVVANTNGLNIGDALKIMRNNGLETVLIEGGGTLAASFIREGVVDRIEWFRAPLIIGGDGRDAIGDLGLDTLDMCQKFQRSGLKQLGDDLYEQFERIE